MSEMKHAPGPWAVIDGYYPSIKEVTGPSFKVSAVVWATDVTEEEYHTRNSDLHLIAAAPDLLEALEGILEYTRSCEALLNASESGHCVNALAAIAKAKGEP